MKPPASASRPSTWFMRVPAIGPLAGILALAIVLRMLHLGNQSFWVDEGDSVGIAGLPWARFLDHLTHTEPNMSLYFTLLRFWLPLGYSEFAVRSFSVLVSVATILVVYVLGARLFSQRVGWFAAFLMALNAFHIEYAQEARSYSLAAFMTSVASLIFVACIERPSLRNWAAYIVTSVLAVYSHVFVALVIVAHWISLAVLPSRDVPWKPLSVSTLLVAALLLPFGLFVVGTDVGQLSWIYKPHLGDLPRAVSALLGSGGYLPVDERKALALPEVARRLLLLVYLGLLAAALARAVKSWRVQGPSREAWHYSVIVSWAFVPMLLSFGISLVKPIFHQRYLIVCLPPLTLLAALGLSGLTRRWAVVGVLVVVAVLAGREVNSYFIHTAKEDWRGVTAFVVSQARPGDAVVFYAVGSGAVRYYHDHLMGPGVVQRAALVEYSIDWSDAIPFARHQFSLAPLRELRDRARRLWLVRKDDWTVPSTKIGPVRVDVLGNVIQRTVEENRLLVTAKDFRGGIHVRLYRAP